MPVESVLPGAAQDRFGPVACNCFRRAAAFHPALLLPGRADPDPSGSSRDPVPGTCGHPQMTGGD
jgi:hypothetical protein